MEYSKITFENAHLCADRATPFHLDSPIFATENLFGLYLLAITNKAGDKLYICTPELKLNHIRSIRGYMLDSCFKVFKSKACIEKAIRTLIANLETQSKETFYIYKILKHDTNKSVIQCTLSNLM